MCAQFLAVLAANLRSSLQMSIATEQLEANTKEMANLNRFTLAGWYVHSTDRLLMWQTTKFGCVIDYSLVCRSKRVQPEH
jgi:hypothetical protein